MDLSQGESRLRARGKGNGEFSGESGRSILLTALSARPFGKSTISRVETGALEWRLLFIL